jgi:hypothetical protein
MAKVGLAMVSLLAFLRKYTSDVRSNQAWLDLDTVISENNTTMGERSIQAWLDLFIAEWDKSFPLPDSIPEPERVDGELVFPPPMEWSHCGVLLDIFRYVICLKSETAEKADGPTNPIFKSTGLLSMFRPPSWAERTLFPGPHAMGYRGPMMDDRSMPEPEKTIEELDAYYIWSGPFKLKLSKDLGDHLTVSNKGVISLYWEGRRMEIDGPKSVIPGMSLAVYKFHSLGGFHPCAAFSNM